MQVIKQEKKFPVNLSVENIIHVNTEFLALESADIFPIAQNQLYSNEISRSLFFGFCIVVHMRVCVYIYIFVLGA